MTFRRFGGRRPPRGRPGRRPAPRPARPAFARPKRAAPAPPAASPVAFARPLAPPAVDVAPGPALPAGLPIRAAAADIVRAVATHRVVVVESPTGSGKTTQIPQILFDAGLTAPRVLGVTQPRRLAAISICRRIAAERGVTVGDLVGYQIRFDDVTSPATRIKIMTDGILLQELQFDPDLSRYSLIMVDEAHERSLNIDFVLGLLKDLLGRRADLRIVVSSATLDAQRFLDYFPDAAHVFVPTRPHPVDTHYLRRPVREGEALLRQIVATVGQLAEAGLPGDVLVFLPGEAEIRDCCERLRGLAATPPLAVLPLFGRLSPQEQEAVFDATPGRRKVVVATNVAETSLTIDGVRIVIDSGIAKIQRFDHRSGIALLASEPIAQASADQRQGRAGRTAPGVCFRLYTPYSYARRPTYATPEVLRVDLSEVVLRMLALGVRNVRGFDFLTPPDRSALAGALEILQTLGAVTADRRLTPIGRRMAELPLEPHIGRMVVEAVDQAPDVLTEVLTLAAFLSVRTPYAVADGDSELAHAAHRALGRPDGDFRTFLHILAQFERAADPVAFAAARYLDERTLREVAHIRDQLAQLLAARGVAVGGGGPFEAAMHCLLTGLGARVCRRSKSGAYRTIHREGIQIHPGSALFGRNPEAFVAGSIVETSRPFARTAQRVEPAWVAAALPGVHRALWGRPGR